MVIGTKKDNATLILLTLDSLNNSMNVQLTESFKTNGKEKEDIGHVTAICILAADKGDKRMGHSDPQILLGFSQGAILVYRIRASVYSYKASRIRAPVDLSEFTEFPGYPITQLSCARSYNSLLMNVALAQQKPDEIKYQYRQTYIKIVETRGDLTGRQRAIINPPHSVQSSAKILETKLIPSTTTLADSTLQLSVVFQNEDGSYDLNIWEVSPTRICQLITLTMDQERCVQSMAKSDTVKSLKLDTNGYLSHVPQKIADIILKENEDEDAKHTATTNSTNHSVVDDQDAKSPEDAKVAELIEDLNRIEKDQDIVDQNMKVEAFQDAQDRSYFSTLTDAETRNIAVTEGNDTIDTKDMSRMEEIEDGSLTIDVEAKDDTPKRECENTDGIEAQVKRRKLLIAKDDTSDNFRCFDGNQHDTADISLKKPQYISDVENVDLDIQENPDESMHALDEEYVVIDHQDAILDAHDPTECPASSALVSRDTDKDQPSNHIETKSTHSIEDNLTLQVDDSTSDIIMEFVQEQQGDKSTEASQHIITANEVLENVQYTCEASANGIDQECVEESIDMTTFEAQKIQMQDDNQEDTENSMEIDEASCIMDGIDYADDRNEMFNQAAYDTFIKQSDTVVINSESEDELEDSQNEEQGVSSNSSMSYTQNDERRDDDLREESYLEESDEVQISDILEKDPIEDKDLLNEQDNIRFVYGGELSDINDHRDKNVAQQIPPQQMEQQQPSNTTVDYIPVNTEDLLKLLGNAQGTATVSSSIDCCSTPLPCHSQTAEAEPQPIESEPEPEPEPVDENALAHAEMIEHCFGSKNVDLDSISQTEIDAMGNYCWHTGNIQLKIFMLKYCQLHQMQKEGFLLAQDLLRRNKKLMTTDEIDECIALKKSLKVDSSVKFGDLMNPFSDAARHKLEQQEQTFYRPQIPIDFYKSGQGQMYLDYYNTGII
ncbi:hypothetical protein [Parasitella parasitica]|uniref:Uncharacterized protein n=1 Tax=Parasitella parasitica TaxID=35722 RepID=A0A0B7N2B4_9FUNG|nr:hypothetical protein [Parasitella parasitica]